MDLGATAAVLGSHVSLRASRASISFVNGSPRILSRRAHDSILVLEILKLSAGLLADGRQHDRLLRGLGRIHLFVG